MSSSNQNRAASLLAGGIIVIGVAWLLAPSAGAGKQNIFDRALVGSSWEAQAREFGDDGVLRQPNSVVTRPPNVILIMADDLGYGTLGSYGQQLIETPQTDKLAHAGMRFSSFYSGAPSCSPSRAALMTGMHTGHTRIRGNQQLEDGGQVPLRRGAMTLADFLKGAGYETAMIGKWGLGDAGSEGDPSLHGFDHVFGYLNQVLAHNSYPEFLWRNGEKVHLENEVVYMTSPAETEFPGLGSYSTRKSEFAPELLVQEAEAFIDKNAASPFFLYFPTTAPHANGEAPEGEKFEVPSTGIYESKDWPEAYKRYAALVSHFDETVGRIVTAVETAGIAGDTIILVTSDNGAGASAVEQFFAANGLLRGSKFSLYEAAIRVPLIAYWPGRIAPGTETSSPVAAWDLFPTILEAARIPQDTQVDGVSFLATLRGESQPPRGNFLHWEASGRMAAVAGRWKAILYPGEFSAELYDLLADPSEKENVASEYPAILHALAMAMRESHWEQKEFPILPSEMPSRVSLRQRLKLIFDQGVFFPEVWPPATESSTGTWRQILIDESIGRMQIDRHRGDAKLARIPPGQEGASIHEAVSRHGAPLGI